MVHKLIHATEVRDGTIIVIEGEPCIVKKYDVSKTGKHGHSKVRLEAVGITDGKKRVTVTPGEERYEVPLIYKKKAQVLSMSENEATIMDLESFETLVLSTANFEGEIKPEDQVEYWDIEGQKIIKRKL